MAGNTSPAHQRYAWINVAVCALVIFFVLSAPAVLMPVMYASVMDSMEWSYGQVTAFASWKFLSGALTSLALGFILGRARVKTVMLVGALLSGLSLINMHLVDSQTLFYFSGFVLGASAVVTAISCKVLLGHWFDRNLGRAVGIAFTGGSIAGILTPIFSTLLLGHLNWQNTAAIFGAAIILLVVPVILVFIREHPEDARNETTTARVSPHLEGPSMGEIARSSPFWLLLFAHFLVGGVDYALMEHTALYLEKDANMGRIAAAGGLSVVMLASICGKIGFGWLYDRYSMRGIALCWWSLALGIALAFPVSGVLSMTLFVMVRGASHGGVIVDGPCIALHNFGPRTLAKVVSFISAANMLGAALSTALIGHVRDLTGSYTLPFLILICLAIIAGFIAFLQKPKYWYRAAASVRG